ncbi:MAG TPA: hypothetical protein VH277_11760 [Gemmatimonadaceae bacterium]|nr:hypothetical protein [Gemmatimonadaceae bacterium]
MMPANGHEPHGPHEPPNEERATNSRPKKQTHSLGAGSEAAEGLHGVGVKVDCGADSALEARNTGVGMRDGAMRAGSEPLRERSLEHTPGYGGEGGAPRTSSDEREHLRADGTLEGEE